MVAITLGNFTTMRLKAQGSTSGVTVESTVASGS